MRSYEVSCLVPRDNLIGMIIDTWKRGGDRGSESSGASSPPTHT